MTDSTAARRRARRPLDGATRTTVLLLFCAWTVDYVDRLVVNLALPAIGRDFGLDHTGQGMVVSAFFLAYALFQIPGGLVADRYGARRVVLVALVAWSAFTALTALAWSFAALLAVRFLFGAAEGVFPGASMKALTERTAPAQRMTANGWMQSSNAFGTLLAPLLAAPLIAVVGWRTTFVLAAVLGVVVVAAVRRWLPAPVAAPDPGAGARRSARQVLAAPVMWRFAAMFFGYDLIVWGLSAWVPAYLQTERGVALTAAGAIAAAPTLLGGVTVVLGGRLSDRFEGRQWRIVVPAMTVAACCLVALPRADTVAGFVGWLAAASAFSGLCYMPVFAVPLRSLPASLTGAAAGMVVFGGQCAGVVAPFVMGWTVDHYSYTAAFAVPVVGAFLTVAMAVATPQTSERFLAVFAKERT